MLGAKSAQKRAKRQGQPKRAQATHVTRAMSPRREPSQRRGWFSVIVFIEATDMKTLFVPNEMRALEQVTSLRP
jgi:hypothetical protein